MNKTVIISNIENSKITISTNKLEEKLVKAEEKPKWLLCLYDVPSYMGVTKEECLEWAKSEFDNDMEATKKQCWFSPIKIGEVKDEQ